MKYAAVNVGVHLLVASSVILDVEVLLVVVVRCRRPFYIADLTTRIFSKYVLATLYSA